MAKKILIVEDEKPIANVLFNKLKSEDFEATLVHNGQEAIKALAQEKFDLILLDLMMPVLDGFGVMAKMKENNINTPVIILSNLGQEGDIKKALSLGAKSYFVKADTSIKELITQVNQTLAS